MKKILSIILAVAMLLCFSSVSFADEIVRSYQQDKTTVYRAEEITDVETLLNRALNNINDAPAEIVDNMMVSTSVNGEALPEEDVLYTVQKLSSTVRENGMTEDAYVATAIARGSGTLEEDAHSFVCGWLYYAKIYFTTGEINNVSYVQLTKVEARIARDMTGILTDCTVMKVAGVQKGVHLYPNFTTLAVNETSAYTSINPKTSGQNIVTRNISGYNLNSQIAFSIAANASFTFTNPNSMGSPLTFGLNATYADSGM